MFVGLLIPLFYHGSNDLYLLVAFITIDLMRAYMLGFDLLKCYIIMVDLLN